MSSQVRLAIALLSLLVSGGAVNANTLKYAFQGSLRTLDPYALNESFSLHTLNNVYEGLITRGPDLTIEPGLAERWEIVEPTRWRFYLRKNVKFHNGNAFTADDVLFSVERVRSSGSDLKTRIPSDARFIKIDDHTLEVVLNAPNPILHSEWETWGIMDKEWTEANGATAVSSASGKEPNYAALKANGTGPFKVVSHQPDVKTLFVVNDGWWGERQHNLERVEFTPISSGPTRVAALLSGDLDLVYPIPAQDIPRIESNAKTRALTGPELRTIFLGMDQHRDPISTPAGEIANPFKDIRVRKAIYHAISADIIKDRIMRGLATPTGQLISPILFDASAALSRLRYDPGKAKALLSAAGYENGFDVVMDCPTDRYVNDEAICQAVVSFLGKVGIRVRLNAQPKAKYFAKVLAAGGYDTSFYLLGWTPGSSDSWNVLYNLLNCRTGGSKRGPFNLGGYCNPKIDELTKKIRRENDKQRRDALILQAYRIAAEDVAYVPLHQQAVAWGIANHVSVEQRADNALKFRYVRMK